MIVAVPAPEGVNRPLEFTLPLPLVTDHVTDWLGDPVPVTVALHWLVWEVVIEVGEQEAETPVTVLPLDGARATLTFAKPPGVDEFQVGLYNPVDDFR